jgi:two-component system sensor histidine kinase KdpD
VDGDLEVLRALGHELRRPLTVIRGAASLLLEDAASLPPTSREQMLRLIEGAVDAMDEMIDDLSVAGQLRSGGPRVNLEPVALEGLVEAAVAAATRQEQRQVLLSLPAGVEVLADRAQAVRCLRCLIANALRFSSPDAPVEVVAEARPDSVEVRVLDRGAGVAPEDRDRAFEPFVRLDHRAAGAGLGLFLARGLARRMGGDVGLEDRPGGGLAAWVTLPRRG